jgi:hypothetical protein
MTDDIKIRILSERKIMMIYKIDVVCFGTVVDSLKVYSIYSREEDGSLKLKKPKERFFNKISMKFSISKSNIKYKYVGIKSFQIENESFSISHFLDGIVVDNIKLISKMRDVKLAKLLE